MKAHTILMVHLCLAAYLYGFLRKYIDDVTNLSNKQNMFPLRQQRYPISPCGSIRELTVLENLLFYVAIAIPLWGLIALYEYVMK